MSRILLLEDDPAIAKTVVYAIERAGLNGLNEGQRITFEVEPDKKGKGPKAVNLVLSA